MQLRQLIVPASVFLLAGAFSAFSDQRTAPPKLESTGLDMMVVGETISPEHKRNWKVLNELAMNCAECGVSQAFPGDELLQPTQSSGSQTKR